MKNKFVPFLLFPLFLLSCTTLTTSVEKREGLEDIHRIVVSTPHYSEWEKKGNLTDSLQVYYEDGEIVESYKVDLRKESEKRLLTNIIANCESYDLEVFTGDGPLKPLFVMPATIALADLAQLNGADGTLTVHLRREDYFVNPAGASASSLIAVEIYLIDDQGEVKAKALGKTNLMLLYPRDLEAYEKLLIDGEKLTTKLIGQILSKTP